MRTIILIDGPHIYALGKQLGFAIDFKMWREMFQKRSQLVRNYYFTAVRETDGLQNIRPLLDYLEYNGFTVVEKRAKEYIDDSNRPRVKGDMRVDIAVLALQLAQEKVMEEIVLVAGDEEFVPLIHALKALGIIVTLVSTISESAAARVADDLRRAADVFVDIASVRGLIERKPTDLKS